MSTTQGGSKLQQLLSLLKAVISPNFVLMILVLMCNQVGAGGYTSAMGLWAGNILELNGTQLGLSATLSFVAMIVIRPFAGKYSDAVGIKFQIIFGSLITAASVILMGIANTFVLFVVMRCAYFLTRSVLGATTMSVTSFCSDRRYMGMNTALQAFIPGLVSTAGVFVAQSILNNPNMNPSTVWVFLGVAYVIGIIPGLFINLKDPRLVERQEAQQRQKAAKAAEKAAKRSSEFKLKEWLYYPILPIACLQFFNGFVTFSVEIVAVILGVERGFDMVVYWLAGVAIFKAFGGLIGGVLADVFNRAKYTVPPCLIFSIISCLILIFTTSPVAVTFAGALFSLGSKSLGPVIRKVTVAVTPDEYRGAMLQTTTMMTDFSGMFGSMLAGILCDALGAVPTLWVTACFPACGLLVFAIMYKKIAAAEEVAAKQAAGPAR